MRMLFLKSPDQLFIVQPENSHAWAEAVVKLSRNHNFRSCSNSVSTEKIESNMSERSANDLERIVLHVLQRL